MLQPLVRRTWAPRGQTPVMYSWDRHDRLSAIGALTVSVKRGRLGFQFAIHKANIASEEVEGFLREVARQLGRRLTVVLDRWSAHRKAARLLEADKRFAFEWLPAYAPDLNPVESLWGHVKYGDLANYVPDDVADLEEELEWSFWRAKARPDLLRSFFHAARLEL